MERSEEIDGGDDWERTPDENKRIEPSDGEPVLTMADLLDQQVQKMERALCNASNAGRKLLISFANPVVHEALTSTQNWEYFLCMLAANEWLQENAMIIRFQNSGKYTFGLVARQDMAFWLDCDGRAYLRSSEVSVFELNYFLQMMRRDLGIGDFDS